MRVFAARGVVQRLSASDKTVVIQHEAITNFMDAMTMPFKVKSTNELAGLERGDAVVFQLHVTPDESWVDGIAKTGAATVLAPEPALTDQVSARPTTDNAWLGYKLTNELGQAVSLADFRGQALAITFFYTRCPLPDYCPRLSKNFQLASRKLLGMASLATNWHFLSISFDPRFDSPPMLRAYGESYQYDSRHWSFLTGTEEQIVEIARRAGVKYRAEDGVLNHNFRTLIVDPAGHLTMVFPTSGDLSEAIASEVRKAMNSTNASAAAGI